MKLTGKYLEIDWENWLIDVANKYENKEIVVEVKEYKENRTNQQNRYLFGVVYKFVAEHTGYTVEEIHELFKAKFLREDNYLETEKGKINLFKIGSTAKLNTKEFYDYVEKIKDFSAMYLGIVIPSATDDNILRSYEDFIGK